MKFFIMFLQSQNHVYKKRTTILVRATIEIFIGRSRIGQWPGSLASNT